jgi:uncharacterized protein YdbL (DUF1318 family)
MLRRVLSFKAALACVFFAACVTVNVYFPAAAAEQAADRIIDTVTQQPGQGDAASEPNKPEGGTTSRVGTDAGSGMWLVTFGRTLELLVPSAHAQAEANIDISSPEIRAITASMQQRFGQLRKYFSSGAVGLTANGDVAVRDPNAVPLAERAVAKRLVAEDNADRAALYAAIAQANGHPEWEPDIRRTFARRWIERGAEPGWYYEDSGGNWVQK